MNGFNVGAGENTRMLKDLIRSQSQIFFVLLANSAMKVVSNRILDPPAQFTSTTFKKGLMTDVVFICASTAME